MKLWNLAYSVTNACNLRCAHCYARSETIAPSELTLEEIQTFILDECEVIGTRFITLTGGEPLTRMDIFDLIKEIKSRGIQVCLATNGTLLSDDSIAELKKLKVDRIQISLEGNTAQLNDAVRGNGVFDKLTGFTIPKLIENELFVAVSLTPTSLNNNCLEDLAAMCHDMGINSLSIRRFSNSGRGKENSLKMNNHEHLELLRRIWELKEQYDSSLHISTGDPLFSLIDNNRDKYLAKNVIGGCTAGIASLAIDAQGNIKPCTRANLLLGNVRKDSMSSVWNSNEVLSQIRDRGNLKGKCCSCKYKMLCGGCRVAGLENSGDILSEDPECWI